MRKKNEILEGLGWSVTFDNITRHHTAVRGIYTLQEKSLAVLFRNAIRVI